MTSTVLFSNDLSKIQTACKIIKEMESKENEGDIETIYALIKYNIKINDRKKAQEWYSLFQNFMRVECGCLDISMESFDPDIDMLVTSEIMQLFPFSHHELQFLSKSNLDRVNQKINDRDLELKAIAKIKAFLKKNSMFKRYTTNLPCINSPEKCYQQKLDRIEILKKPRWEGEL